MGSMSEYPVNVISTEECWEVLAGQEVGRFATSLDRFPEIFPMNYVVDDQTIVFRTAEGSKLFELTANDNVAFEVDGWDNDCGWSVIVKGTAHEIEDDDERDRVEGLGLRPWVPTVKRHVIRIVPSEVTGRRFCFGAEPEPDYT